MIFLPEYSVSGNLAKVNNIKQKTSFVHKDVYCSGSYLSEKLQTISVSHHGSED